jgi:TetR/AcrR family transcriptional regulator, transcriptional repressor for nem operon
MNDSREQILNISFDLLLEKSYNEVSIQDIVNKVGMTKGAFYYFFKSKEELFSEIFTRFIAAMELDYARFSHDSLYQFLHDFLDFMSHKADSEIKLSVNSYFFVFDTLKRFPNFQGELKRLIEWKQDAWKKIVRIAREKEEIKSSMSDEQIAGIFIFILDGVEMRSLMEIDAGFITGQIKEFWDGFYAQIKA